ncbi:hypothetical protein [Roseomonas rosulenta]|uniref:hypothetical protein n=1 Tax=Roseomonas rosulenta TaxID=2748667 RepID=UPI0018DF46B1|nr:hypothetical protein [Roseomonas rosulenta]
MASTYVRRFNLKPSLSDAEVAAFWTFLLKDFVPACKAVPGVTSMRLYSGAGALRADIRLVADLDHAGIYETLLRAPGMNRHLATFYGAMDLAASSQMFIREVTPDLLKALS